jgi:hypothetical protein
VVPLWPWRWRQYVTLNRQLTFTEIHGVIFQKTELFTIYCILIFVLNMLQHISPSWYSSHASFHSKYWNIGLLLIFILSGLEDFQICLCWVKQIWMKPLHIIQTPKRYSRRRQSKYFNSTLIPNCCLTICSVISHSSGRSHKRNVFITGATVADCSLKSLSGLGYLYQHGSFYYSVSSYRPLFVILLAILCISLQISQL